MAIDPVGCEKKRVDVAATGERSTAEQIGIGSIASVVDEFYNRVQQHPTLARPFSAVNDWHEHKDHLTYFWWVTLGGQRNRDVAFSVVLKHARAGFNAELLDDWKAAFADVVRAQIPEPLAQIWLDKVMHLGTSLLLANELHLSRRSKV